MRKVVFWVCVPSGLVLMLGSLATGAPLLFLAGLASILGGTLGLRARPITSEDELRRNRILIVRIVAAFIMLGVLLAVIEVSGRAETVLMSVLLAGLTIWAVLRQLRQRRG